MSSALSISTPRPGPGTIASIFNGQAGLRFKALRVQRNCQKIYDSISTNAVQRALIGIRAEHYLPWLFEPLLVPRVNGVRRAVATVLLSDDLRIQELMNQSGDASIEALSLAAPILRKKGIEHLDADHSDRVRALELLAMQDSAIKLERSLVRESAWQTPQEAAALSRSKLAHLDIVLHHLFGDIEETSEMMCARESLFRFMDVQKKFAHYLLWNRSYPAPCTNRFLIEARGCSEWSVTDAVAPARLAYGAFGRQFLNGLRAECARILTAVAGMHRLQTVVSQTEMRLAKLVLDLEKLHDA